MTTPNVTISKNVFTTTQAPASTVGILAIAACSSTGTTLQPSSFARSDLAINAYGYGPLAEYAAYDISVANNPVVLVKGVAGVAGSYTGLNTSGKTGSSAVTTSGTPYDTYYVLVRVVTGGTIGVAGITFTYSLDGGNTTSGTTALGTASSYTIPNTGVVFNFAAGTLVAADSWFVFTNRPLMDDTGVTAALAAIGMTRLPYEGILLDCSASASTVGLIDAILQGWEGNGVFKFALMNARYKLEPEPTAESEATYAAAMQTLFQNQTSIRVCVGGDGAHVPSLITGYNQKRPVSMLLGARAMSIPIGVDPAYVATGPINGAALSDTNGNPYDHDEDLYPTLDSLRLVSMRSFAPAGPQGAYITNANTIQPSGGAFPYLQHVRIMNRACEIAWFVLTTQLSRGVRKNPNPDPVTGAVYIFEPDAAAIESLVNDALVQPLKGQVSASLFSLSRTDNLNVVPCIVTGVLSIVALAYIKGYTVQSQFSKTLTTAV